MLYSLLQSTREDPLSDLVRLIVNNMSGTTLLTPPSGTESTDDHTQCNQRKITQTAENKNFSTRGTDFSVNGGHVCKDDLTATTTIGMNGIDTSGPLREKTSYFTECISALGCERQNSLLS